MLEEFYLSRATDPPTTDERKISNAAVLPDAFEGQEWVFLPGKLRPCLVASSDRECRESLFKRVVVLPIESYNNPPLAAEIKAGLRAHNYPVDGAHNFGLREGYVDFSTPQGLPKEALGLSFVSPICRMNQDLVDDFIDHYAKWFMGDDSQ